jgi:hypothetical protein
MHSSKLICELVEAFFVVWVGQYALYGANRHATWGVVMAYTLSAFIAINFIYFSTHLNGLIRALIGTQIAVDTFFSDKKGHTPYLN